MVAASYFVQTCHSLEGLLEHLPVLRVHVLQVQLAAAFTLCDTRLGSFNSKGHDRHEAGGEILRPARALDVDRNVIVRIIQMVRKSMRRGISLGARGLIL